MDVRCAFATLVCLLRAWEKQLRMGISPVWRIFWIRYLLSFCFVVLVLDWTFVPPPLLAGCGSELLWQARILVATPGKPILNIINLNVCWCANLKVVWWFDFFPCTIMQCECDIAVICTQAAVFNQTEIAFVLMDHGARLDCKNSQGNCCYHS